MLIVRITLNNSDGNVVDITETTSMSLPGRNVGLRFDELAVTVDTTVARAVDKLKGAVSA